MKKILLASILMAFGASAQAAVVADPINCSGSAPNISCIINLTCSTSDGNCATDLIDFESAICFPLGTDSSATRVTADNELNGAGPVSCSWTVTDPDDAGSGPVTVTIDNSNGLPVELQSLSVE
jgi:hypothetical protein